MKLVRYARHGGAAPGVVREREVVPVSSFSTMLSLIEAGPQPGDVVRCEVDGIGAIQSRVAG